MDINGGIMKILYSILFISLLASSQVFSMGPVAGAGLGSKSKPRRTRSCSICMENFTYEDKNLKVPYMCGVHRFHNECIRGYASSNPEGAKQCPECNQPLRVKDKNKALLNAARGGNLDELKKALSAGAETVTRDEKGNTPLILSSWNGYSDTVKELLSSGADPESKNLNDETAIILAGHEGYEGVIDALAGAGANVDAQNKSGNSALHLAAFGGHINAVKALLKHGANKEIVSHSGRKPIDFASLHGQVEVVEILDK